MEQTVLSTVEIFKTDVKNTAKAKECIRILSSRFPGHQIDFDLEDRDNILRMEGNSTDTYAVIHILEVLNVRAQLFLDE